MLVLLQYKLQSKMSACWLSASCLRDKLPRWADPRITASYLSVNNF